MLLFDTLSGACRTCCAAVQVLEQNYRFKMQYSPDYQGIDIEKAGGGRECGRVGPGGRTGAPGAHGQGLSGPLACVYMGWGMGEAGTEGAQGASALGGTGSWGRAGRHQQF